MKMLCHNLLRSNMLRSMFGGRADGRTALTAPRSRYFAAAQPADGTASGLW